MQKLIAEDDDHIENKVAQHTERKIEAFHQQLDELELQVLSRPSPHH